MLEFRLLGPVEVWVAGRAVAVGEPRRRAVLASLLSDADRVVPTATIMERVWGFEPPPAAAKTLSTHISRIRRMLAQLPVEASVGLVSQAGGYRLTVDPGLVDLHRCRQLTEQARHCCSATERVALLRDAVELWRGEALSGVPGDWAARTREHLCAEYLEWVAAWAQAELDVSNPDVVPAVLAPLADAHPLMEGLTAVLVRALVALERPTQALERCRLHRRYLAEEYGTDQSAELRQLADGILQAGGDRAAVAAGMNPMAAGTEPAVAGPGLVAAPQPVPAQLPLDVRAFAGRWDELSRLDSMLDPAARDPTAVAIAAISGTAGVGKTALAVRWAHRAVAEFTDGQLYVDLRGYHPDHPLEPADVLTRFLAALGFPGPLPLDLDDLAARFRSAIAGRRILIVLDNASSAQQVRPLLPGTASCAVVVTSRDSLAGLVAVDGAHRLDLGLLSPSEAQDLLCRLLGDRARADPAATAALAEFCVRLPLALRIAAESATARPNVSLAGLVAEIGDQQRRLDLLDTADDVHAAITAVFSWSVRRLRPESAVLFGLLGLHPGPDLDASSAAALAGSDIGPAGRELDALARAHLVHPTTSGRYGMHDLLRAYAGRFVASQQSQASRTAARRRMFGHYLSTAARAMDRLRPAEVRHRPHIPPPTTAVPDLADAEAARAWLDDERPVLVALARHAATHGEAEYVVALSSLLFHYLDGGHFADALAIHASAYRAARQTGDLAGQANALRGLGSTDLWLGRQESAEQHLRRALDLFRQVGDQSGEARTELSLGVLARRQGRYDASAEHHERSLMLARQTADPIGETRALTNLGVHDARLGRHRRAAERLEQALALCRRTGDRFGEAHTLTNLGLVEQQLGCLDAAAVRHRGAADLFRVLGNRHGVAHALDNLGGLYLHLDRPRLADRHLRQALALFRALGDRDSQASTRNSLGEAARRDGRHRDAVAEHAAALGGAGDVGNPETQARAHDGLGRAYYELGHLDRARHHLEQALTRYTDLELTEADAVRKRLAAVLNC